MSRDVSVFDDCNLSNVKVYLNSEFFSYDDLNLDFGKKRYTILFDMYARFHKAYYGINRYSTCSRLSKKDFLQSLIAHDKTNLLRVPL